MTLTPIREVQLGASAITLLFKPQGPTPTPSWAHSRPGIQVPPKSQLRPCPVLHVFYGSCQYALPTLRPPVLLWGPGPFLFSHCGGQIWATKRQGKLSELRGVYQALRPHFQAT